MRAPRLLALGLTTGLLVFCAGAFAELSIIDDGPTVTVKSDRYAVTLDRRKGATITQIDGRPVEQKDAVDSYVLAADPEGEVTVTDQSPGRVVLVTKGRFMKDGQTPESKVRAEYTYTFVDGSPIVRCRATLRQDSVVMHADVYGYPAFANAGVLDFGDQAGWKGAFSTGQKTVTVYMAPAADKPFTVADDAKKAFDTSAVAPIARGEHLLEETFKNNDLWTDVAGTWEVRDHALVELSPGNALAWTVAGHRDWTDYIVDVQVRTQDGSAQILVAARWQDVDNHYELQYLEWPANCMRIVRVEKGRRTVLAEVRELPDLRVKPYTTLALAVHGASLVAYRNGERVLEASDGAFKKGPIALGVVAEYPVSFLRLDVYALPGAKETRTVTLFEPVQRHGFYREEKNAKVGFIVKSKKALDGAEVAFRLKSPRYPRLGDLDRQTVTLGKLRAFKKHEVCFDLHPERWRSGDYTLYATVSKDGKVLAQDSTEVFIRRRPNPDRMLVNAWDYGDPARLAAYGFNQCKVAHDNTMSRWDGDQYRTPDDPERIFKNDAKRQHVVDRFDDMLKSGMWGAFQIEYIRRVPEGVTEAYALQRDGKTLQLDANGVFEQGQRRPNPWHPDVPRVICDFFRKALAAWKDMPAWHGVLLNSESENRLNVYGNDYFLDMARKELGFDVPEDATSPRGVKKYPLPDNGIIDSNDPHYRFYRWWWERGEGQGQLHAKVSDVIHEIRPDLKTWHDPALRQPFVRGRCAGTDQVLMWWYAWPNIDRFPMLADEFRAAAPGQESIFMIQLIVWGGSAIPREGPHWDYIKRTGSYIPAHSPAAVREATWLALSRGVDGLSYHAVETTDRFGMKRTDDVKKQIQGLGYRAYLYSNPDTLNAIKEMSERVVQPYGQVIKRLTPVKGDVAMLLSTANMVLGARDSESFEADQAGHMYAKFLAAHVPVDVMYEIDLEEKGLDGYRAVALPGCRVLPQHLYDIIKEFADRGGIVFADQEFKADLPNVVRLPRTAGAWGKAGDLVKEHVDQAADVHKALDDKIARWADCDSPTVILSALEDGPSKYLFVVNNRLKPGEYVGGWGKVFDDGAPQTTQVRIRKTGGAIYDLLEQKPVDAREDGDWLEWRVTLGPAEGRVFAVRPEPLGVPLVTPPKTVAKGDTATISVTVPNESGGPAKGLVPLRVTVTDSQGVGNEYTDWYVAKDGAFALDVPIALNDPSGDWEASVRELVSGNTGRAFFEVKTGRSADGRNAP